MHATIHFTILAALLPLLIPVLAQQHNVTVVDTDPSITYQGEGTGDALLCKFDANGQILGGQPGCYNVPANCTSSVAMSQNLDHKAAASFKFKGSAIYINSALNEISPIYTVTVDGIPADVDGVRPSLGFTCTLLFSETSLDPTIEHTITLSVKGPSPNRNMTQDRDGTAQLFSLINFIYTAPDSTTLANSNPTPSTASNSTTKTNASAGACTAPVLLSGVLALGLSVALGGTTFSI